MTSRESIDIHNQGHLPGPDWKPELMAPYLPNFMKTLVPHLGANIQTYCSPRSPHSPVRTSPTHGLNGLQLNNPAQNCPHVSEHEQRLIQKRFSCWDIFWVNLLNEFLIILRWRLSSSYLKISHCGHGRHGVLSVMVDHNLGANWMCIRRLHFVSINLFSFCITRQ